MYCRVLLLYVLLTLFLIFVTSFVLFFTIFVLLFCLLFVFLQQYVDSFYLMKKRPAHPTRIFVRLCHILVNIMYLHNVLVNIYMYITICNDKIMTCTNISPASPVGILLANMPPSEFTMLKYQNVTSPNGSSRVVNQICKKKNTYCKRKIQN